MNNPPSEGNESVIDIFVLSKRETVTPPLRQHLENQGYRVTLFNEGTQLLETLSYGKPNLLICDTTTNEPDDFEVCRQIKTDDNHWMIPVLILTGASDLGDLLKVLDCNADNFIAHPYDPPYLLSLIEGMLTTPVERQTPDQIKTQFKIQHDERVFVVTADRRKLLEFLLSSFEIAVSKSADVVRAEDEILMLKRAAKKLEESITEHTRVISIMNETLQKKEQKISVLFREVGNKEEIISERDKKIGQLSQDLEADKTLLTSAEEHIRIILMEKEETGNSYRAQTDELNRQLSSLASERDSIESDLKNTQRALADEKDLHTTTQSKLADITVQKEYAEKTFDALKLEHEKLKTSLIEETNRAQSAEQETQSVIQAKTHSEQNLSGIIDSLRQKILGQEEDLTHNNEDLAAKRGQINILERQLDSLKKEKQELESSCRSAAESLNRELGDLTAKYETAVSDCTEKNRMIQSLHEDLSAVTAQKLNTEEKIESVSRRLDEARAALENEEQKSASLEDELESINAEKEKSEHRVRSLSADLEEVRSALEKEQDLHHATAEDLNAAIRERDGTLQTLRGAHEVVQTDLDTHKDDLKQLKKQLEEETGIRLSLEESLETATKKVKDLEKELHAAIAGRAQSGQQVRSLADELEQVKGALETERRLHRTMSENLKIISQEKEQSEQELQKISRERDQVKESFKAQLALQETAQQYKQSAEQEKERLLQQIKTAEDTLLQQQNEHGVYTGKLQSELESAHVRLQSLDQQVITLTRDKVLAEQKTAALTAEIDQARTALADEWEDHMNANERLAGISDTQLSRQQPVAEFDEVAGQKEKKRSLIVKEPILPVEVQPVSQALTNIVQLPEREPVTSGQISVEDLFEEDEPVPEKTFPAPEPLMNTEPVSQQAAEEPTAAISDNSGNEDQEPEEDQPVSDEDASEENEGDEEEDHVKTLDEFGSDTSPADIAFNRQQWLDLLKWSHHSEALSHDQRLQIVRMGRLIQKGRRLTHKQEDQVKEMLVLVRTLGYRFT